MLGFQHFESATLYLQTHDRRNELAVSLFA